MNAWQKNLVSLWLVCFITGLGTSQLLPFLPLYISQLGHYTTEQLTLWSGVAFSMTFLVSAIVSPLRGKIADKRGRKLMLIRATVGMAIAIVCQGLAQSVWQLCLFRGIMGLASGYIPNAMALIAGQAPKGRSGFASSMLSTAQISGFLCGPLLGAVTSSLFGMEWVYTFSALIRFVNVLVFFRILQRTAIPKSIE
ncbi:MFS transporter, DHA1 family, multidrug resistance protein [Rosenbergiella nectarea]|uniref:MFS transporter, DHA1 family, multidrug resistance protein n=1 Tax=Rosenbergiella nectarea TaxID=988801 RepID=A0A1H9G940_9GAMM|nr:MFS transporter [Rosenbergiella nectarea]SEQ46599.1 MFS transporter, DHA1 family, multidrug resistance protein [Rosenbergiella nectarea]